MGKYTGCQCTVCQNIFQDDEDIVVCPDCGTPYHRTCYQAEGRCVNVNLHAVGGSWQNVQNEQRLKIGGITCPHCGYVNMPDAKTCNSCDLPLPDTDEPEKQTIGMTITTPDGQQHFFQASDPCCGISPEYDMEGERLGDVANFVRTNTLYYIPLFRRFKETNRKLSVNLPCVLFPYFYFANRKMWLMTIISGLICLLCTLPDMFLNMIVAFADKNYLEMLQSSGMEMQMVDNLASFLTMHQQLFADLQTPMFIANVAFRIALCLFGNYLYFRYVMKSVKRIRKISPTQSVRKAMLTAEGGTNLWNILGCCGLYLAVMFVFYLILLFFFA